MVCIADGLSDYLKNKAYLPEWGGEGLPPVGCECEYSLNAGITWHACKIGYLVGTQGLVMHCDVFEGVQWVRFDDYEGKLKFRPLRTEADKKRESTVDEIMSWMHHAGRMEVELIYDAIKSGKIVID